MKELITEKAISNMVEKSEMQEKQEILRLTYDAARILNRMSGSEAFLLGMLYERHK